MAQVSAGVRVDGCNQSQTPCLRFCFGLGKLWRIGPPHGARPAPVCLFLSQHLVFFGKYFSQSLLSQSKVRGRSWLCHVCKAKVQRCLKFTQQTVTKQLPCGDRAGLRAADLGCHGRKLRAGSHGRSCKSIVTQPWAEQTDRATQRERKRVNF